MVKSIEQERVRELLRETITVLCRNGLQFKEEFSVEALIGITLDKDDVFLVSIKENVNLADEESELIESLSDDSTIHSTDNQPKRKRKKKTRNGDDVQCLDTSAPVEKRVKTISTQQSSGVKHEPGSEEHMDPVHEIVGVTDQAAWSEQAVTHQIIEPAPTANMTAANPILEITTQQQPTQVQVQPQMIMAADPNAAAVQGMQANNVLMEISPQQVIEEDQHEYATTSAQEQPQQYVEEEDEEDEEEEYEEYADEGEEYANARSSGGFNDDPHTRPYGCRSCDYTSQRTYNLRRHVESYGHNGYMCNICVKIYNRKMWFVFLPDLKKHVGKEHREEQQAAANRKGATSLGNARSTSPRRVVRKSAGGTRKGMDESFEGYTQLHICMECNTPFPDKQSLIRHFTAEHTVLQPKLYQCVKCKKYFDTEFKLKQHSATEHVQSGFKYQCTDCDAEFAEKNELKDHVHSEHRQLPVEGIIHCEDCGKEFKTNVAFKRHAATCGAE